MTETVIEKNTVKYIQTDRHKKQTTTRHLQTGRRKSEFGGPVRERREKEKIYTMRSKLRHSLNSGIKNQLRLNVRVGLLSQSEVVSPVAVSLA